MTPTARFLMTLLVGLTLALPSAAVVKELQIQVVRNQVTGDEGTSDTFVYTAPPGFEITAFEPVELALAGEAAYDFALVSPDRLEVEWSTQSEEVRAFGVVMRTDDARLDLDARITLEAMEPGEVASAPPTGSGLTLWMTALIVAAGLVTFATRRTRASR